MLISPFNVPCSKIETVRKSFDSRNNGKVDFYCRNFLGNLYIIF